jgi:hypothetical protein
LTFWNILKCIGFEISVPVLKWIFFTLLVYICWHFGQFSFKCWGKVIIVGVENFLSQLLKFCAYVRWTIDWFVFSFISHVYFGVFVWKQKKTYTHSCLKHRNLFPFSWFYPQGFIIKIFNEAVVYTLKLPLEFWSSSSKFFVFIFIFNNIYVRDLACLLG